tara:strand:- start:480 stop:602 length:123 start_codon:yes stop_codon:yes gene_type:complete
VEREKKENLAVWWFWFALLVGCSKTTADGGQNTSKRNPVL